MIWYVLRFSPLCWYLCVSQSPTKVPFLPCIPFYSYLNKKHVLSKLEMEQKKQQDNYGFQAVFYVFRKTLIHFSITKVTSSLKPPPFSKYAYFRVMHNQRKGNDAMFLILRAIAYLKDRNSCNMRSVLFQQKFLFLQTKVSVTQEKLIN